MNPYTYVVKYKPDKSYNVGKQSCTNYFTCYNNMQIKMQITMQRIDIVDVNQYDKFCGLE